MTGRNETLHAHNLALAVDGDISGLVVDNLALVRYWVHRSKWRHLDTDELYSAGVEGLLHAARKYDPARGTSFGTYATWWVRQGIDRAGQRAAAWHHLAGGAALVSHPTETEEAVDRAQLRSRRGVRDIADDVSVALDATAAVQSVYTAIETLPSAEAAALRAYLDTGGSLAGAARTLGVRDEQYRWRFIRAYSKLVHPSSGVTNDRTWTVAATCRSMGPERFFTGRGRGQGAAMRVCAQCPVRGECATTALADTRLVGVWGGTTEHTRRHLRRGDTGAPST